ncbi:M23 family metallopeptidase [Candidatus Gracilibacteria bacterium]|nr:M23 family metallopeptidase [Candidatus Gracilibacteria bacterium]
MINSAYNKGERDSKLVYRLAGWHYAGVNRFDTNYAQRAEAEYKKELGKSQQKCQQYKQQQKASKGCTGEFINPAPGYPVTDNYGWSAWRGRVHHGIDLGTPIGTSIKASDGGTVSFVGTMDGYGITVDIDHCGKYSTRYAHLSQSLVKSQQPISSGQAIAKSGNTGIGTGAHLHFEIRLGGRWGASQDPKKFVKFN